MTDRLFSQKAARSLSPREHDDSDDDQRRAGRHDDLAFHHLFDPGKPLNAAWSSGVASARFLNLHQRHRDLLKIANLGDFCGTRWQTNIIMIPTPGGKSHLMPPGKVIALDRKHTGHQSVRVTAPAPELEVVASRTDGQFFLHAVNTHRTRAQSCLLAVEGFALESAKAFEIATDPQAEITSFENDPMPMREKAVALSEPYAFPAASVTALELTTCHA